MTSLADQLRAWADLEHQYSHDDEAVLRGSADRIDALEGALGAILHANEEDFANAWLNGSLVLNDREASL